MEANIIEAIIAGGLTLTGVVITNLANGRNVTNKIETAQAVTDVKIEDLTREVRKHNNFAMRIPVVENDFQSLDKRMSKIESYIERRE